MLSLRTNLCACIHEAFDHLLGLRATEALLALIDDDDPFDDSRGLVKFLVNHVPRSIPGYL